MGNYCAYPNLVEFNQLVENQTPKLYAGLEKKFANLTKEEIEDTIQESFLVLWTKVQEREDKKLLPTDAFYLWGICKNKACDMMELNSKFTPFLEEHGGEEEEEFELFDKEEYLKVLLKEALDSLSPRDKELITLHCLKGLSFREIALQMGYNNEDTAKAQKYRAFKSLKNFFMERNLLPAA